MDNEYISITSQIETVLSKKDLSLDQATELMDTIFDGKVSPIQIAAFLTANRAKGACAEEIAGFAKSLRSHANNVKVNCEYLVDTCGTGGAAVKTFNISTAAAFVAAGAGVYVAKHGNRAITSSCGSADVLSELGVKIDVGPEIVASCIEKAHIGFMFAPMFHPAMKYVQPVRKELGFRTVFNILGPLANPANANAQVMGVADQSLMEMIAETLKLLGVSFALVVHSDGLDEISTMGPTKILELKNSEITEKQLDPTKLGIAKASLETLKGQDKQSNARIIKDVLNGEDDGPHKDIIVLNAAAAIIAGQLASDFEDAIELAKESISSGKAMNCLDKMVQVSNS